MIGFDEATGLISAVANPRTAETVALAEAAGRVLAAPVVARIAAPVADVSAMDGYALREADLALDAALEVIGESFPGAGFTGPLSPMQAVRIFTGAPVPPGADRVVVQELAVREGKWVRFSEMPGKGTHIRGKGCDFTVGATLLEAGTCLTPGALVAAAGADQAALSVWQRPRLFVVSTGDELVPPGMAAERPGTIPESVSPGVAALAAEWGAQVVGMRHVADDLAGMQTAATEIAGLADVIIVTGGASVGERDFSRRMFEPLGLEMIFAKVTIKPGKPVWLARLCNERRLNERRANEKGPLILGLPGNPTSALVTARLFLAPLLAGLSGRAADVALRWRHVPLASSLKACGDRETFTRAKWQGNSAVVLSDQDSGAQRALAEAELLIRQRAGDPALKEGEAVEVLEFG